MSTCEAEQVVSALVRAKLANKHASVHEESGGLRVESRFSDFYERGPVDCYLGVALGEPTPIKELCDCFLPAQDLRKALRVRFSGSKYYRGRECVRITIVDGGILAVATDGRRIAAQSVSGSNFGSATFNLPLVAAERLYWALSRAVGAVDIFLRQGTVLFRFRAESDLGVHYVSLASEAAPDTFPQWTRVLPYGSSVTCEFGGRQFAEAVERTWKAYRQGHDPNNVAVTVEISPGVVRLSYGDKTAEIAAPGTGEAAAKVNIRFLREFVQVIGRRPAVSVEVWGRDKPVLFRADGLLYAVMPMVWRD